MNGNVVRARRVRSAQFLLFSFFFFPLEAHRGKTSGEGGVKPPHGSAVILLLLSAVLEVRRVRLGIMEQSPS